MVLRGLFHDFPNKSKMADGGHIEFCNANISLLDKDMRTKFGAKMQHHYAEMPTWPKRNWKLIRMTSSDKCREQMRVVLTDYTRYLNQNLTHGWRNKQPSWRMVPSSLITKIQNGSGRHIKFRKMSISPTKRQTGHRRRVKPRLCAEGLIIANRKPYPKTLIRRAINGQQLQDDFQPTWLIDL